MKKLAFGALFVGLIAACGGNHDKPMIIDGPMADSGSNTGECNVLMQTGCDAGQKCTWVIDQEMPTELGHVGCAPDGNVDVGGACMYGAPGSATGYDNCKKGSVCLGGETSPGVCKTICDQNGGAPMCDANHSCQLYDGLLGPSGMEAAGVCDPLCNPLDDNDFDGSGTKFTKTGSGCGSAQGCFGYWRGGASPVHFSCSGYRQDANLYNGADCTPDNGCETMDGTGAYINGCSAGYVPMYLEPVGATTMTCQAYCKPADCSSDKGCGSNNISYTGADPHRCANADANGDFTKKDSCIYGWYMQVQYDLATGGSGNLPASAFNDTVGICYPHSAFMLPDPSGQALSTTPEPECSTMVASGAPGGKCQGSGSGGSADFSGCYGVDFGCVSTTTGGVTAAFKDMVRKHLRTNIRLPYHMTAHQ